MESIPKCRHMLTRVRILTSKLQGIETTQTMREHEASYVASSVTLLITTHFG